MAAECFIVTLLAKPHPRARWGTRYSRNRNVWQAARQLAGILHAIRNHFAGQGTKFGAATPQAPHHPIARPPPSPRGCAAKRHRLTSRTAYHRAVKQSSQTAGADISRTLFGSLMHNAIDFLQEVRPRTAKHLNTQSSISQCHWSCSLKARLLCSRGPWSFPKSKRPPSKRFAMETFTPSRWTSVSSGWEVAGVSLLTHEQDSFRKIRDHRNKLVHFFPQTTKRPYPSTYSLR